MQKRFRPARTLPTAGCQLGEKMSGHRGNQEPKGPSDWAPEIPCGGRRPTTKNWAPDQSGPILVREKRMKGRIELSKTHLEESQAASGYAAFSTVTTMSLKTSRTHCKSSGNTRTN